MTRHLALGTALIAALLITPLMTTLVYAQTNITMAAGEEKEVCAGVKAAVTPNPPKSGELRTDGDPKSDAAVKIFYKAKDTSTAAIENLTCTADGKPTTVNVAVTPKRGSTGFSEDAYPEAFKALFLLFVLAIILESALAILFNWRPFVETFNSRAVKPVVSLAVAWFLVAQFGIDLVTSLAKLITPNVPPLDATGRLLTAMVIAGGSAGVNNLMVGLGFRQPRTAETVAPKPPANKGWISVAIVRTAAIKGPVTVGIGEENTTTHKVPVVAALEGSTRPGFRYFLRDKGRFPGSGGYAIAKDTKVTVKVSADKADGSGKLEKTWGDNVIADGAIIDLTFTMSE